MRDILDTKVYENLDCKEDCELNWTGHFHIWQIICRKCKGTNNERFLIDKSYDDFNARKEIINQYDFTDVEKEILQRECWY